MALVERRSEPFGLARSDAVDEILEVRLTLGVQGRLVAVGGLLAGQCRPGLVLPSEVDIGLVLADLHPALGAEDVQRLACLAGR